jgi:hypothetical protein
MTTRIQEVSEELEIFCKELDRLQELAESTVDAVENELSTPENDYDPPLEPAAQENFVRLRRFLTTV